MEIARLEIAVAVRQHVIQPDAQNQPADSANSKTDEGNRFLHQNVRQLPTQWDEQANGTAIRSLP